MNGIDTKVGFAMLGGGGDDGMSPFPWLQTRLHVGPCFMLNTEGHANGDGDAAGDTWSTPRYRTYSPLPGEREDDARERARGLIRLEIL